MSDTEIAETQLAETETADVKACPTEEVEEEISVFDISYTALFKLAVIAEKTDQEMGDLINNILDTAVADWEKANNVINMPEGCQSN